MKTNKKFDMHLQSEIKKRLINQSKIFRLMFLLGQNMHPANIVSVELK